MIDFVRGVFMSDDKCRNWATIIYADSAPKNFVSLIDDLHIQAYLSPLHDRDIDNKGNFKKAHYHLLMMFDGQKNMNNMQGIIKKIGGVGCEKVISKNAYARYLIHKDNPEKAQYSMNDVRVFGGAVSYDEIISDSSGNDMIIVSQMLDWIKTNDVYVFYELVDHAKDNEKSWFAFLIKKNCHLIWEYIRSRNWAKSVK